MTTYGYDLKHYKDGRIEVPQSIIRQLNIEEKYVKAYTANGVLCITNGCPPGWNFIGKTAVSRGRIRIPISFLRCAGLDKKQIRGVVGDYALCLKSVSSNHTRKFTPGKPLLILPEEKPLIFRIVGAPYKFLAHIERYKDILDLKLVADNSTQPRIFYLIPGIQNYISHSIPGFLLMTLGELERLRKYAIGRMKDIYEREIIFLKNKNEYRVFLNPPDYISKEDLENAQKICSGPERFLTECFEKAEKGKTYQRDMIQIITQKHIPIDYSYFKKV